MNNLTTFNTNFKYTQKLLTTTHLGQKASKNFLKEHYFKKLNSHLNTCEITSKFLDSFYIDTSFKVIHVTGTAGKGSTSKMIAKGLEDSGFKVGLFTSPHMLQVHERIQINSKYINKDDLENLLKKYYELYPHIMFCEILTLVAIEYFSMQNIDYAVFEVFVGGEYDTTNIFNSVATIITSIGLDHQHLLGNSYEKILSQKLGIIRENVPLFTRIEHELIHSRTQEIGARYNKVDLLKDTNLVGEFQRENAGIAYEVLKHLGVDSSSIEKSLMNITMRGRLEYINSNILVDCAHNELALRELLNFLEHTHTNSNYVSSKTLPLKILIFGISNYKDLVDFSFFFDFFDSIIFTKSSIFKAKDLESEFDTLSEELRNKSKIYSLEEVYNYLKDIGNDKTQFCLVSGSVFLVADVLKFFSEYEK